MSFGRQVSYQWQRWVLRRPVLLAEDLPLGMRFEIEAQDDVGRRIFKYQVHEPHVLQWLQNRPAPGTGALALDVGANLGWYSILFDRLSAGRLATHAFEPEPANLRRLQRNIELNHGENIQWHGLALSDQPGSTSLHRYRAINRGKHSLLSLPGMQDAIDVPRARLDDVLQSLGLAQSPVWCLKLDVEGHEPEVIAGARETLARTEALIMEFTPAFFNPEAARQLVESLTDAGLQPHLWDGSDWRHCSPEALLSLTGQCDTVWAR